MDSLRCYYWGEDRPVVNLGDLLVPYILRALGYKCVPCRGRDAPHAVNPDRCLIVIGSLLTKRWVERIGCPLDVWGCGWLGKALAPSADADLRFFAVRGPQTAAGLGLPPQIALGDPALLLPQLWPLKAVPHHRTVVIPHFSRLTAIRAAGRRKQTGCETVLSPMVFRPLRSQTLGSFRLSKSAGIVGASALKGIRTHGFWHALRVIAGADFVLSGSLHGAILSQAFGVPWAAYADGYLDAPAKWTDWAAYLGIDIELVQTIKGGREWWRDSGCHGRTRDLKPLLHAFPYGLRSEALAATLSAVNHRSS
jgi:hypothetical protein